jgi:hypothetical protein
VKLVPTFADRECRVVSATDPCGRYETSLNLFIYLFLYLYILIVGLLGRGIQLRIGQEQDFPNGTENLI